MHDTTAPRLRWLPLWRGLGWLLLVSIIMLSLMPAPPHAPGGDKLHHFLAYFGLMLLFGQWHERKHHPLLALAFMTLGIAIELIQPLTGRYFSWMDMLANSSGVFVAWFIARGKAGRILTGMENRLTRLFSQAR
ncbi:MAG: VanZ family protein [Gammaproteobacteria bacterium]|nr:VanZ family protein [Gammaproteobacteria bacterium]